MYKVLLAIHSFIASLVYLYGSCGGRCTKRIKNRATNNPKRNFHSTPNEMGTCVSEKTTFAQGREYTMYTMYFINNNSNSSNKKRQQPIAIIDFFYVWSMVRKKEKSNGDP